MRVLVIYAHTAETSFVAAPHRSVKETLASHGHEIDDLDLYADRFDPVMPHETYVRYVDVNTNTKGIESYVAQLRAADAMVLVFPIWFDGLPAILQGYFQRVFLPGVAITIDEHGAFHPNLQRIRRLAAVCTYGESQKALAAKGDPPRRFIRKNIGRLIAPNGHIDFLGHYGMNSSTLAHRRRFLERVKLAFAAW
jgi:NAD(P)H dehydrogenase (quinone)